MLKCFLPPLFYLKSDSKYSFSIMNFSKDSTAGAILFFLFGLLEQPCYNPVVSLAHIHFLRRTLMKRQWTTEELEAIFTLHPMNSI